MSLMIPDQTPNSLIRRIVRWGLYPASWAALLFGFHRIVAWGDDPRTVWAQTIGAMLPVFLVIEMLLPYEARWSMTLRSFLADLKFVIFNAGSVAAISAALAYFTITTAGLHQGPASNLPLVAQVVAALLIFEAINYALHRAMHRMGGPLGWFLWRSHAAHHLPPRLYLVMHAVFHPVNAVIIQALAITLPIWAMGHGPKAVAMFLMINGMHGLISHFNVDVRAGWLNYVFVGTELHRYHHSAVVADAGNFGATLSIFDQLFGTFVYRPGVPPAELGVDPASGLPAYERFGAVMTLPFRRARAGGAA
jgi:sterol desaturase/sphingolipid hydroxylase (fatty acid hydroxylase superfamily)